MNRAQNRPQSPIRLSCPNCGAPSYYDIANRTYRCTYCQVTTPPVTMQRRISGWRAMRQNHLRQEFSHFNMAVYSCPNCGASVTVDANEATARCSFCGGSLVRRGYNNSDSFPELIIPFRITEQQAKQRLAEWAQSHKDKEEREIVLRNIQHLKGFYLPYQFVRGPIECTVDRDATNRKYHCGGHVDDIAVNASSQLDNEVLDAAEPFVWDETTEFSFGYVAGHSVKMQDITGKQLANRVRTEVANDYLPEVEKVMHTKGLDIYAAPGELQQMPVLLPMHIIKQKNLSVAVNGQTGAVAVTTYKKVDTSRFWFREPILVTLAVFIVTLVLSNYMFAGMFALTAGLIAFTAFSNNRKKHLKTVIHTSHDKEEKQRLEPVFREPINGQWSNVDISFYTPFRVARMAIGMVLFNVLPLLLSALAFWAGDRPLSELDIRYIVIWLVISIPMTFIFWIAYVRRDVYEHPTIRQIMPDGSLRKVSKKELETNGANVDKVSKLKMALEIALEIGTGPLIFVILFVILMFVMSIVLMTGAA